MTGAKVIFCGPDSGMPSEADQAVVRLFAEWLTNPEVCCCICMKPKDECDIRVWKTHPRLGRVFFCGDCKKVGSRDPRSR